MNRVSIATIVVLVISLFTGHAISQQVIVVDQAGGPGADYTDLAAAIFAAAESDILLIRPGEYGSADIINKSLTLIGDIPERPLIFTASVSNLAADQTVLFRGLAFDPRPLFSAQSLNMSHNLGSVIVEDCVIESDFSGLENLAGVRVTDCDKVSITRCSIKGGDGLAAFSPTLVPGGPGIFMVNSSVYLYGSSVSGGNGVNAFFYLLFQTVIPAGLGGPGVVVHDGLLFSAGATITGGIGGNGLFYEGECYGSGDGGLGMIVNGPASLMDNTVLGGAPGNDPPGCPQVGMEGAPFHMLGGSIEMIDEPYRSYEVDSPVRIGDTVTLKTTGVPGEPVWLLLSPKAGLVYYPQYRGALFPDFPLNIIFLGFIAPNGELLRDVTLRPGMLPPGIDGKVKFEQVIVPGQDYSGVLSAPSAAVIISDTF